MFVVSACICLLFQPVNVGHEIGHALGLYHDQARADRDKFVNILFENIEKGKESNFMKEGSKDIVPYDYHSIMHYPSKVGTFYYLIMLKSDVILQKSVYFMSFRVQKLIPEL